MTAENFENHLKEAHAALWNEAFNIGSDLANEAYYAPETLGQDIARLAHHWHLAYMNPRAVIELFSAPQDPRYYDTEVPSSDLLEAAIELAKEIFQYGANDERDAPAIIGFARGYHTGLAHQGLSDYPSLPGVIRH